MPYRSCVQAGATPRWRRWIVIAALGVFAGLVEFWRLGTAEWLQDEYVYATAGYRYAAGKAGANMEHPPLAKLLIGIPEHLFGFSPTSARLAAVGAAIVTGIVLALLARRLAGEVIAYLVFGLWIALPHPTPGWRLDRTAMLDVFAACFAVLALLSALRWVERPGWRRAAITGALVGAAAASKLSGAPVAVAIAAFVAVSVSPAGRAARQLGVAAVAAVATFLITYAPIGANPWRAIPAMIRFQAHEASSGYALSVAGTVYRHPPWWSALWFAWHRGPLLVIALLLLAAVALVWLPWRVAMLLGLAVLVPLAAVSFGPGRFFEFYAYVWAPPLVLLAAIGLGAVWARGTGGRVLAVVLVVPMVMAGASSIRGVLTLRPAGYALAGPLLNASGARTVLVVGPHTRLLGYVCPGTAVFGGATRRRAVPWDAIVHDRTAASIHTAPWQPAELSAHPERFSLTRIDQLDVYIRRGLVGTGACRQSSG